MAHQPINFITQMKTLYSYLTLALLLILSACNAPVENTDEIPADLSAKKERLKTLRSDLREVNDKIKELEDAIAAQDPNFAPKLTLVNATSLAKSSFSDYGNIQATVQPEETAMAGPEVPGRILKLRVDEGDNVRRGQLIATLDVESVSSQRAELETASSLAKTVYDRQKRLWEQNIGSELQYLEAKNNYERLQQSLKSVDVQLAKANVYAPISGTIQQVMMRTGENAMPGAPIVSIISTGKLKVVADASEEFLTKVKRGQSVKVNIPALGESFTAPISRIGKTIDAANRTFEIDIKVPAKQVRKLKTNLLAEVEILKEEVKDVIVISQDMVQQEVNGRSFVFLAVPGKEEGSTVAKKAFIEPGSHANNMVLIRDGLSVGDKLITTGSRGLVDGQHIALSTTTTSENNGK